MSAQADTLAHATCEECGDTFSRTTGESWKRLCLSCWKASPAAKKVARDKLAQLTAELAETRAERDRLRLRVLAQRVRNHPTPRRVLRARYEFDYDIRKGIRTSIRTATRTACGRSTQLGTHRNRG